MEHELCMSRATKKVTFYEIFKFVYEYEPTEDELINFINENNYFKREQRDIPDRYQDCPEHFFGFLELMEHEYAMTYDNQKLYFWLILPNGKKKKCWLTIDPDYLKIFRAELYVDDNRKHTTMVRGAGLTNKAMTEFLEKVNNSIYY